MKKAFVVFSALVVVSGTLFLAVHAFNNQQPSAKELKEAFPEDSYEVFTKSQHIVLYSLEPERRLEGKDQFHGYSVLGKLDVSELKLQADLKSSLLQAMASADGAACFNPRHGLRLLLGAKTVDLVICFECGTMVTYYGEAKGHGDVFGTPAHLYNRTLREAGVPVTRN